MDVSGGQPDRIRYRVRREIQLGDLRLDRLRCRRRRLEIRLDAVTLQGIKSKRD